jgi:hypothetical protein
MMPSQLILQSDQMFDVFVSCPWYNWNLKNRKTLLICMANSINPLSFCFAGMTLGYKFSVNVGKWCPMGVKEFSISCFVGGEIFLFLRVGFVPAE